MSSCIECKVHEIKTCDSRMFESEPYHSSGTEHADKYSNSRMLMSMTKIEQGLLFLIDKWLEKDAPQVQPTAEMHSITVLTQSSFVIIVIIICFILR